MLLCYHFTAGVFHGHGFPLGLKALKHERPNDVALMWSINGVFSVLGSVVAIAIAMTGGFRIAMVIGAVAYMLLTVLVMPSKINETQFREEYPEISKKRKNYSLAS